MLYKKNLIKLKFKEPGALEITAYKENAQQSNYIGSSIQNFPSWKLGPTTASKECPNTFYFQTQTATLSDTAWLLPGSFITACTVTLRYRKAVQLYLLGIRSENGLWPVNLSTVQHRGLIFPSGKLGKEESNNSVAANL
jgi:hypothetical protein